MAEEKVVQEMGNTKSETKVSSPRGRTLEFPTITINAAVDVAKAVMEHGGFIKDKGTLSEALNVKGGALAMRITGAKRYGLIEGNGEFKITELGKSIVHPLPDEDPEKAKATAILQIPLFKKLYKTYGSNLPEKKLLKAVLNREYNVQMKATRAAQHVITTNLEEVPSLIDELKVDSGEESKAVEADESEKEPEQPELKGAHFPLHITAENEKHTVDITDEVDWDMVKAIITSIRKKWEKKQTEQAENQ